jgi:predicted DNA-binding transcriptional regulator AlpA
MKIENKVISPLIKEKVLSELTGMSLATLRKHRWLGKGIPYIKIGRSVRYLESDVQNFLDQLKVQTNPL